MTTQDLALEELVWRSPEWAMNMGGVHENSVLFYFAKSPFFDPISNNASVETQALYNPDRMYMLETREAFENELDKLNGLEYRVHLSPRQFGGERPIGDGLWVIRKQNRQIIRGVLAGVDVLSTYFVLGETIQMAPSIGNILASRLLSTTASLNKVFEKSSSMSLFTPALGHHYMPPNTKSRQAASGHQGSEQSKESTPGHDQSSQLSTSTKVNSAKIADLGSVLDAYAQFNSFGNEYMDENPLQGEPTNFVFSGSAEHVRAQKAAEAKRAQQQADLKKMQDEKRLAASRNQSTAPDTPQTKMATLLSPKGSRAPDAKSSSGTRLKRKKTKGPGTPATPVSAMNG